MTGRLSVVTLVVLSLAPLAQAQLSMAAPTGEQALDRLAVFDERRPDDGPPLTLAAALDEALANNPTLVALRRRFEVARLRPDQARFLMPPTFEAQIWQWPISTLNPADTNMYMFMVRQELPGYRKREARAAVLEAEAAVAENTVAVRARDVVDQVKLAYADLYLARKAIDIQWESVDLLRQFADVSAIKYATGGISQQDVLKAVVELSTLHEGLVEMDQRARLAEARLNTLLNRPPEASIGPLGEPTERVVLPASAALQRLALEQHPEIRSAVLERDRAEAALVARELEYAPDFFVGGGYMLMPGNRDAWSASVGFTWPRAPWSRGGLDAQVAEAQAGIEAATARQRVVENAIRLAVHDAYVRVQSAAQRAALLRTSILPQSEQTLEVSRVAYQADRVAFLALIDNQRVLLDVELDYYEALSDLEQAMADLERAVGTELDSAMIATVDVANDEPQNQE